MSPGPWPIKPRAAVEPGRQGPAAGLTARSCRGAVLSKWRERSNEIQTANPIGPPNARGSLSVMDESLYHEMLALERRFWWFVAKRNIILHLVRRFLRSSRPCRLRACDIGCGCGALLERLADEFDAVGVEASGIGRTYCEQRGLAVREGSLPGELPFEPKSFDVIVLSDVLEHVVEDRESVIAVTHLLRRNGLLLCTVPAHPWLWTQRDVLHHHVRRYGRRRFRSLFTGLPLREELLSYYNIALFPAMMVSRLGRRRFGMDRATPDLKMPPGLINAGLRFVFESEKYVLGRANAPIGGSLISIHRKIESSP